jgi:hypothetical protein
MPTEDKKLDKPTNSRKYEVGTALDFNRQYRDPANYGEILGLEDKPSVIDIWNMIGNDAQAHQLFTALKLPLKSVNFDILAGEGDSGERDFVEWALNATARQGGMTTPMRTVIAQMGNALAFRIAPFEKVWHAIERGKYKGYHTLHKLGYRPPSTCTIRADDNGSFNGFVQRAYKGNNYKTVSLSPQRSLVYIHNFDSAGLTGMTAFDTVYKNYLNKLKVSFFYYAFLENVAFPRTLVKVAGDDPEELQALLDKARMLASQGILGLYDTENIESYESQRNTRDYQSALEYLDWQMAKAVLGQFLDLGTSGERGSYALSKDKSSFFYNALEAVLGDITEAINNYVIADLAQYNFGMNAAFPRMRFKPLNDETADAVLETYRQIIMANTPNVTPTFMLQLMKRVEEILGLELDPLAEYSDMEYWEILRTIPTAREHLLSRESRAGAGQNPTTGQDRNENNEGGGGTVTEKRTQAPAAKSAQEQMSDELSIINQMRAPETQRKPRRRRRFDRRLELSDEFSDLGDD